MAYIDTDAVHAPATGQAAPAAWALTVADNLVYLADRPTCRVRATTAQTLTNGVSAFLDAPVEDFDSDGMHSTTADTSRLTAVTAGRYLVWATVEVDAAAPAGQINNLVARTAFMIDGVTTVTIARDTRPLTSSATPIRSSIAAMVQLRPEQYIEVNVFQNSGETGTALLLELGALFLTR